MIIDSHQHFWKYDPHKHAWLTDDMTVIRRDFLPDDLAEVYNRNSVDGCVTVQVQQDESENHTMLQLADRHQFIKGIVGWVDLRAPGIEERLEHYSTFKKLVGFRHIVQGEKEEQFLLRKDFCRGVSFLQRHGFTYDILVYAHQLVQVPMFVDQFPGQPFIIDHIAKPDIKNRQLDPWRRYMKELAKREEVFCKISGMVTEAAWTNWKQQDFEPYFNEVLEAFGSSRILYGSDWPVCLVAASYEQQLSIVRQLIAPLTEAEQKKILAENAIRFYHL